MAGDGMDNLIGIFSPKTALKRKMYREGMRLSKRFLSSYKGARKDRVRGNWIPGGNSADEDLLFELPDLRERSRDLNRNDPYASGITNAMVTNVIGSGIRPQSRINREALGMSEEKQEKFQKAAELAWKRWIAKADICKRKHFYDLQALAYRSMLENGELLYKPARIDDDSRHFDLVIEMIEADRLETPMKLRADKTVRSGVKINDYGGPRGYWIRQDHPGDVVLRDAKKVRKYRYVPFENTIGQRNIYHIFKQVRCGQTRGVPMFASVLNYFKDLSEAIEAELLAQRIAACFAIFIKSEDPVDATLQATQETNASGQAEESIEPGMIKRLHTGEDISTFTPQRPGWTFDPFVERTLRGIAASINVSYEVLARDFSKVNYSSARASLLESRRFFKCEQEMMARDFCQPCWEMVLEEAWLRGELPVADFYTNKDLYCAAKWICPGWEWVDPMKEAKAAEIALKNRSTTLSDVYASRGEDWEEGLEQLQREDEKIKKLKLPEQTKTIKTIQEVKQVDGKKQTRDREERDATP
jgi:lambda family phage portal protein